MTERELVRDTGRWVGQGVGVREAFHPLCALHLLLQLLCLLLMSAELAFILDLVREDGIGKL